MRVYELDARYDSRKTFYGKAQVVDYENGKIELLSYGTPVSCCEDGKVTHYGKWSATTTRLQKEFERQFG